MSRCLVILTPVRGVVCLPGVIALVSAIGNNDSIALRKLRLRDNYISGTAGRALLLSR